MTRDLLIQIAKFVAVVLLAAFVLYVGSRFLEVLLAGIIAGILYYLSLPIVVFMEGRRVPRVAAIFITFAVFLTVIVLLLLYLVPVIIEQLTSLVQNLPSIFNQLERWLGRLKAGFGERLPEAQLNSMIDQATTRATRYLSNLAASVLATVTNFFSILLSAIAGVVAAFYLLKDRDRIWEHVDRYIPEGSEGRVHGVMAGVNDVLAGFLRGQIIIAIIVGVLVGIALVIIGLPYAFVLAIVATVFELVPYLGPILAAIPAILLALSVSTGTTIYVLIAYFIIQQVESLILSPRIIGANVRLHPATVIFAILIGKQIIGLLGIFIAIPVAGVAKVLIEEWLLSARERREVREEDQA